MSNLITLPGQRASFPEVTRKRPFAAVTVDQLSIPIWRTRWHDQKRCKTYVSYTIAWSDGFGRHREKRSTLARAKSRAGQIAIEIINGDTWRKQVTQEDWAIFQRCLSMLGKTGPATPEAVEAAVRIYTESVQILGGRSPLEAARSYAAQNPLGCTVRNISNIIPEYLAKRRMGAKWRRVQKKMLERFGQHFTGPFNALTAKDIDDWLDSLKTRAASSLGLRSRRNYLHVIASLATYAKARGYLAETWSVLDSVSDPEPDPVAVNIYTPDELVRLLNKAESTPAGCKLVPFIAITAFAGIRHGEMNEEKIHHLDWSEIDFESRSIYVGKGPAKTGSDRTVDMPENLMAWLLPYRRPSGKICSLKNTSNALCRLRARAGIQGPKKNALRKSFISYQVAATRNIDGVADQAGNSSSVIRKNYKRTDTRLRAAAARWFAIMPLRADVLPLFAWAKKA